VRITPKATAASPPSGSRRTSPYPVVAMPGSIPRRGSLN